jgi:hypothetical protein
MSTPNPSTEEPDSGYPRLEAQIRWYDGKSQSAQALYKRLKVVQLGCGALVPFTATINPYVTGVLGGVVVVLEGLQQLNQWQHNWITYRSTCEALRHEKYLYMGGSGVYDGLDPAGAKKVLVERVESLISTEHAKWTSRQEYDLKKPSKPKSPEG